MRIWNIYILKKQTLECLFSKLYQSGLVRGYGLGQIAGKAEGRNKGVILSANVKEQIEKILKESEL